jgi:hypothetical protein
MSIEDVRSRWGSFQLQTLIMFTGINDPQQLATAQGSIGPFPDQLSRRNNWLHAAAFLMQLERAVQITDTTLRQENTFVAATNEVAAKVQLPAPKTSDINTLVDNLDVVNQRIQQDQRFSAAVRIGLALADEIDTRLKKKSK